MAQRFAGITAAARRAAAIRVPSAKTKEGRRTAVSSPVPVSSSAADIQYWRGGFLKLGSCSE